MWHVWNIDNATHLSGGYRVVCNCRTWHRQSKAFGYQVWGPQRGQMAVEHGNLWKSVKWLMYTGFTPDARVLEADVGWTVEPESEEKKGRIKRPWFGWKSLAECRRFLQASTCLALWRDVFFSTLPFSVPVPMPAACPKLGGRGDVSRCMKMYRYIRYII